MAPTAMMAVTINARLSPGEAAGWGQRPGGASPPVAGLTTVSLAVLVVGGILMASYVPGRPLALYLHGFATTFPIPEVAPVTTQALPSMAAR